MNQKLWATYFGPLDENREDVFNRLCDHVIITGREFDREYFYKILNNKWFLPATPILKNYGYLDEATISCFINNLEDNPDQTSIAEAMYLNDILSINAGGLGMEWTSRPDKSDEQYFERMDKSKPCFSQEANRSSPIALYCNITSHFFPQLFKDISGLNGTKKYVSMKFGVKIKNDFMEKVKNNETYLDDHGEEKNARETFAALVNARLNSGAPYIFFEDNVNENKLQKYKDQGIYLSSSNLCAEVILPTRDTVGNRLVPVCCLGSINIAAYDEWKNEPRFYDTIYTFMDNVLERYLRAIDNPDFRSHHIYKPIAEGIKKNRSIGIGAMGLASYFAMNKIPFTSDKAKELNIEIFKHIHDGLDFGHDTYDNLTAVAPTSRIAKLSYTSSGIEPFLFPVHDDYAGTIKCRTAIPGLAMDGEEEHQIIMNRSVRGLGIVSEEEEDIYLSAFEMDQQKLIDMAADRQPFIDQGQSFDLYYWNPDNTEEGEQKRQQQAFKDIFYAWRKGLKTLYYSRNLAYRAAETFKKCDDNSCCQ
jgi:ribonucleoside-diphosphate reductase alpha chain